MADDNCLTDDSHKWESWLISTSGSRKNDGKIEITKVANKLKGTHENSKADLEDLKCDGANISFSRVETRAGGVKVRIFYKNGIISGPTGGKLRINGKYEEEVISGLAAGGDTGDWQAEKPTE